MTATQNISTDRLAGILDCNTGLGAVLDGEIKWYGTLHEPGTVAHGTLVEDLDRATALIHKVQSNKGTRSAAYFLRRVLSGLRHAAYLQCNEDSRVFNLHAEPEKAIFFMVDPNTGAISKSISRQPITNLDAYRQAIEAKTGKQCFVAVVTQNDQVENTTSRKWK